MKYRTKPVTIEAVRVPDLADDTAGWGELAAFMGFAAMGPVPPVIKTLEGDMQSNPGDYIIRGLEGEYYPCKPSIFERKYEPADKPTAVRLFPIPPGTARTKCQRCPEMIFHVPNTKNDGGTMPLSIEPELRTKLGYVATAAKAPTSEEEGYGFSHFSNCPAAGSFRKGFVGLEILIMLLFAAVFLFALGAAYIEAHAENRCLAHGYPQSNVTWTLKSYCIKRVNQTDTVVLLSDLEKK